MENKPPPPSPVETSPPQHKQPTRTEQGCGCLVILVAVVWLLRGCLGGGISKSDLKDPPKALEKLTRQALSSAKGFEYIKVETYGQKQDGYFLNVSYRSPSTGGADGSFKRIKHDMDDFYVAILSHPELHVVHLKINAQLELSDKYGNNAWVDVYLTSLDGIGIQKLNRDKIESVVFEKIWDVEYIHPIFWPFKE
jgi:hypothetical protein